MNGRRGYWLRQLSDCAEPDFAALLKTLQQYAGPSASLYAKCMDGATWQGTIDPKTPLNSVQDVLGLMAQCAQAGVDFAPVVVPRGEQDETAAHAALASAVGALIVDIETGSGFYDGAPVDTIPWYWYDLRVGAPMAFLVSQPDPRNLESVLTAECLDYFDAFAAQHYVGWTAVGWSDPVTEVARFDAIRAFGKPCYPLLYAEGDAPTFQTFWRAVRDYSGGVGFFKLGTMGPQEFAAATACKLPQEPV